MPKYLKDYVKEANGCLLLLIDSIGSQFTNDRGKDVKHVSFRIKSSGTVISDDILAFKFKGGFNAGDTIEAFTNEQGYVDFKKVDATAESSSPLRQTTHEQLKGERAATEAKKAEDEKWERIDLSKIIFGYMNTAMARGNTPKEAGQLAEEAYRYQEAAIEKLMAEKLAEEIDEAAKANS